MPRKNIFTEVARYEDYAVDGESFKVPILYRRLENLFALYTADYQKTLEIMPSPRLHPVRVWPGRCLLVLVGFNYLDTDIGPYGEFMVGVPCTCKWKAKTIWGVYVHRLPVTTKVACVAGRHLWGYPKFVGQMEFQNTPESHAVKISEGDQLILELWIQKGGAGLDLTLAAHTFTVKEGQIIHTQVKAQGMLRAMPDGLGRLQLGTHEMGLELERLKLGKRPLVVGDLLDVRGILPAGEIIGPV